MKTLFELDWFFIGSEEEIEENAEQTIKNCSATYLTSSHNSNPTLLIAYDGSKDELAQCLIDIEYFDQSDANEFKNKMREIK